MALRFHWMLPKAGEVVPGAAQSPVEARRYRVAAVGDDSAARRPDMNGWSHWARHAEEAGIDSTLICFNRYEPDPFIIACALGCATPKLKFILAYRSGLMQPAAFVQQINTLSGILGGRVAVNLVAGSSTSEQRGYGDFLSHDDRYARAEEFLSVCHAFWRNGQDVDFDGRHYRVQGGRVHTPYSDNEHRTPAIYISGHSEQALQLTRTQGTCWMRTADVPERIAPEVQQMREAGLSVCLRMCVICRPTYDEAVEVAQSLLADHTGGDGIAGTANDSRMYDERSRDAAWLSRTLWTGLVPKYGPVWTTLLGTPRDLADAFLAWGEIGVDEILLSGWPELDTVVTFGRDVLPLVRGQERTP